MTEENQTEENHEEAKPKATVDIGPGPKLKPTINWEKITPKDGKWKKRVTKPIGKTKTV